MVAKPSNLHSDDDSVDCTNNLDFGITGEIVKFWIGFKIGFFIVIGVNLFLCLPMFLCRLL